MPNSSINNPKNISLNILWLFDSLGSLLLGEFWNDIYHKGVSTDLLQTAADKAAPEFARSLTNEIQKTHYFKKLVSGISIHSD